LIVGDQTGIKWTDATFNPSFADSGMTRVITYVDARRAVESRNYTYLEWFTAHQIPRGSDPTPISAWCGQLTDALDEARAEGEARMQQRVAEYEQHIRRLSGCLLVIAGTPSRTGSGSIRTAAYEAACMGATVDDMARKLESSTPNAAERG
jgi:hypothetical protein